MKKIYFFLSLIVLINMSLFGQAKLVFTEIMYSPPAGGGGGVEYLEIFNNDTVAVNLDGYNFSSGINFTFNSITMMPGEYIVLTNDSMEFLNLYGLNASEYGGFISNNGELLVLNDSTGLTIDSVEYDNNAPWPIIANGQGPSLELCDADSNNADPKNWLRSTTRAGLVINSRLVFGSPKVATTCVGVPIIQHQFYLREYEENVGTVNLNIFFNNGASSNTTVQVAALSGTAQLSSDFTFSPLTITFPANKDTVVSFSVDIINDTLQEGDEYFRLLLQNPSNGAVLGTDTLTITINANDMPTDKELLLIGIFEGNNNLGARGLEIQARTDISDLSKYGIGTANNGGGTDGIEYNFPNVSIKAGGFFVTDDSADFHSFFGFAADFVDAGFGNAINFTGDDAVELYENNTVIDVFGRINTDGTGTIWEYTDGWAHRIDGTGPDGEVFDSTNWFYSGIDVFDDISWNDSSSNPYPLGSYKPLIVQEIVTDLGDEFEIYPNPSNNVIWIKAIKNDPLALLQILDLTGRLQLEISLSDQLTRIDVSKFVNGMYVLQFQDQKGNLISTKKLMVNK